MPRRKACVICPCLCVIGLAGVALAAATPQPPSVRSASSDRHRLPVEASFALRYRRGILSAVERPQTLQWLHFSAVRTDDWQLTVQRRFCPHPVTAFVDPLQHKEGLVIRVQNETITIDQPAYRQKAEVRIADARGMPPFQLSRIGSGSLPALVGYLAAVADSLARRAGTEPVDRRELPTAPTGPPQAARPLFWGHVAADPVEDLPAADLARRLEWRDPAGGVVATRLYGSGHSDDGSRLPRWSEESITGGRLSVKSGKGNLRWFTLPDLRVLSLYSDSGQGIMLPVSTAVFVQDELSGKWELAWELTLLNWRSGFPPSVGEESERAGSPSGTPPVGQVVPLGEVFRRRSGDLAKPIVMSAPVAELPVWVPNGHADTDSVIHEASRQVLGEIASRPGADVCLHPLTHSRTALATQVTDQATLRKNWTAIFAPYAIGLAGAAVVGAPSLGAAMPVPPPPSEPPPGRWSLSVLWAFHGPRGTNTGQRVLRAVSVPGREARVAGRSLGRLAAAWNALASGSTEVGAGTPLGDLIRQSQEGQTGSQRWDRRTHPWRIVDFGRPADTPLPLSAVSAALGLEQRRFGDVAFWTLQEQRRPQFREESHLAQDPLVAAYTELAERVNNALWSLLTPTMLTREAPILQSAVDSTWRAVGDSPLAVGALRQLTGEEAADFVNDPGTLIWVGLRLSLCFTGDDGAPMTLMALTMPRTIQSPPVAFEPVPPTQTQSVECSPSQATTWDSVQSELRESLARLANSVPDGEPHRRLNRLVDETRVLLANAAEAIPEGRHLATFADGVTGHFKRLVADSGTFTPRWWEFERLYTLWLAKAAVTRLTSFEQTAVIVDKSLKPATQALGDLCAREGLSGTLRLQEVQDAFYRHLQRIAWDPWDPRLKTPIGNASADQTVAEALEMAVRQWREERTSSTVTQEEPPERALAAKAAEWVAAATMPALPPSLAAARSDAANERDEARRLWLQRQGELSLRHSMAVPAEMQQLLILAMEFSFRLSFDPNGGAGLTGELARRQVRQTRGSDHGPGR